MKGQSPDRPMLEHANITFTRNDLDIQNIIVLKEDRLNYYYCRKVLKIKTIFYFCDQIKNLI